MYFKNAFRHRSRRKRACGLLLLCAAFCAASCGKDKVSLEQQQSAIAEKIHAFHVLIQYAGAYGAHAGVTRNRASADSLAHALLKRVRDGDDFRKLARDYSDDAAAESGGEIELQQPEDAPADVLRIAAALGAGEISEVFETPLGFHFLQRRDMATCAVQHILFAWSGAESAPDTLRRTRQEALALAERTLAEVNNPNVSFAVAARNLSDDIGTAARGGFFGTVQHGFVHPEFETTAFALADNAVSEIVETPRGFHIIRRVPDIALTLSHILITYQGTGEIVQSSRSREEALERAFDGVFRARQGEDFEALARELSDDKATAEHGGRLPPIRYGSAVAEFEDAAFRLRPGEVSDVVETHFGFHVIKRLK